MSDIKTVYDAPQHCTATKLSRQKTVEMDCPYTGKGEEFSPTNLVEAALGGCILIAMGTVAMRHDIDLTQTRVEVKIEATDRPVMRFSSIDIRIEMPAGLQESRRKMLERAADGCPIKHSFGDDIPLKVEYRYPD